MFVVSIISEGILLQLTDHLLFGQSDPASFALRPQIQPFKTDYFTIHIGRLAYPAPGQ